MLHFAKMPPKNLSLATMIALAACVSDAALAGAKRDTDSARQSGRPELSAVCRDIRFSSTDVQPKLRSMSVLMRTRRDRGHFKYGTFGARNVCYGLRYNRDPDVRGLWLELETDQDEPARLVCVHVRVGQKVGCVRVPTAKTKRSRVALGSLQLYRSDGSVAGSLINEFRADTNIELALTAYRADHHHSSLSPNYSLIIARPTALTSSYVGVSCGTGGCNRTEGQVESDVQADYAMW